MNYRNPDRKAWADRTRQEGQRARLRGASEASCPYAMGGVLSRAWREGYNANAVEAAHCPTMVEPHPAVIQGRAS